MVQDNALAPAPLNSVVPDFNLVSSALSYLKQSEKTEVYLSQP